MIEKNGQVIQQLEEVKVLIVGTEWISNPLITGAEKYETTHHWLEVEVPLFGSSAMFDTEEKARNIYEEIPIELFQFKVEYFWQSEFHWQSDTIKKFLNAYGEPKKN